MQLDWEDAESLKHRASAAMAERTGEDGAESEEHGGFPAPDQEVEGPSATSDEGDLVESPGSAAGSDVERAVGILNNQLDRFVDEVRSSLDFYTAQAESMPLRAMILSGGGSLIGGLRTRLGSALRLDAEQGRVFSKVNVGKVEMSPEQIAGAEPFLGVAVGLALGATED
jgi:type IV pilus assembly protein PilM